MSLATTLASAAGTLQVIEQALDVSQNNIDNASSPGFAAQRQSLEAAPFAPALGSSGGVQAGPLQSSRDEFAERAVQRAQESLGQASQAAASLTAVEGTFDINGQTGIANALSQLYQSFSAWSLTPTSAPARQAVLAAAGTVAQSFQNAAAGLNKVGSDTDLQLNQTVRHINDVAAQIAQYNRQLQSGDRNDPGLDAKIHNAEEELSGLANVTFLGQADGTTTVLLGGQTPLVIGSHAYNLATSFIPPTNPPPTNPLAAPKAGILDANGQDVTSQVKSGSLGSLLHIHNDVLAGLRGDAYQPGELNRLAQAFADRVNQVLNSSWSSAGPPPVQGAPLFTYDATDVTRTAATLAVNPAITADQLAAIDPGPPFTGNGAALTLAGLANPQSSADQLDGGSYVDFYGNMASVLGRELSQARDSQDLQQQLVTQAQSTRSSISGVSLDQEAVLLVQFQRAYQASAKMVTVLDQLMDTTVNLLL